MYSDYIIEIYEHPTYHDFEFIIRSKEGNIVSESSHPYDNEDETKLAAELVINII
jgi:hypothetical protein